MHQGPLEHGAKICTLGLKKTLEVQNVIQISDIGAKAGKRFIDIFFFHLYPPVTRKR